MRNAYKVWSGIAAGVFVLVAVTDLAGGGGTAATPPPGPVASSVALPAVAAASPAAPVVPSAVSASVLQVIDGDTFRLAGGDEVRVLGIDSCEAATPGGQRATAAARALLTGPVTLRAEPGVDRDRYGRALRYVDVGGADFASLMVVQDHTAIYTDGRNDASPQVQATLRRLDTDGRTCGSASAPTTTSTSAAPAPYVDLDRPRTPTANVPGSSGSGSSGSGASGPFANCAAARAAGAAPLHRGEPGYAPRLDRDDDGIACE